MKTRPLIPTGLPMIKTRRIVLRGIFVLGPVGGGSPGNSGDKEECVYLHKKYL